MSRRDRDFGDLERQLRARRAEPRATFVDAVLGRIASEQPRSGRAPFRLGAAVALTSAGLLALILTGGSGFAAYGAHQLTKAVDVVSLAKRVTTAHATKAVKSVAPSGTPPGHQYKVVCGANSPSPCVASIGPNRSVQEAKNKSVVIRLTVSLNAPSDGTATVAYSTAGVLGTTPGVDYASASGNITFGSGQTSAPIAVTILYDGDASNRTLQGETFKVHIAPVTGVTIGTADATITITGS